MGATRAADCLMASHRDTARIEAFSDGVFAIAMTLLVLDIKVPHDIAPPATLLQALARELNERGPGEATFMRCDVSKTAEVERLVDAAVERHGRLDCLVNNAGWHPPHRPIDAFSCQDFRDLFELNVMSLFAACRRALPHLRKTRGNIINMSSLVGAMGQLHATTYVATKGAITVVTRNPASTPAFIVRIGPLLEAKAETAPAGRHACRLPRPVSALGG